MATATIRRVGLSLIAVLPRDEVVRKGLRAGQRVRFDVVLSVPDDFADLCGTLVWQKSAQENKDEVRRLRGR